MNNILNGFLEAIKYWVGYAIVTLCVLGPVLLLLLSWIFFQGGPDASKTGEELGAFAFFWVPIVFGFVLFIAINESRR